MASDVVSQVNTTGNVAAQSNSQATPMVPRGLQEADAKAKQAVEQGIEETSKPIEAVVDNVNEYVQNISRQLNFSVEKDTGKTIIKVVDSDTGDLIRQIPTEEFLELAKALEKAKGILLRTEA